MLIRTHYGRVRKRPYTVEYHRISALIFKPLLKAKLGQYSINSDSLSEQHKNFELIESTGKIKIAQFSISGQKLQLGLIQDNSSASNKLYITCPCCQTKRPRDRLMRKIRNKRKNLWGVGWPDVNNMFAHSNYWPKPKGIHWKTFYKAKEEIYQLERQYWPMVDLHLKLMFGADYTA